MMLRESNVRGRSDGPRSVLAPYRRIASAVVLGAVAACGRPRGQRLGTSDARVFAVPADSTWQVVIAPVLDSELQSTVVPHRHDRSEYNVFGSLRVESVGGTRVWSTEYTVSPIIAAVKVERGWRFAARDGEVYESSTFTGALVRVAATDGHMFVRSFAARDVLALLDDVGRLWLGHGSDLTRVGMPAGSSIRTAAFVDASFGVVIDDEGRTLRTIDGGRSFMDVHASVLADSDARLVPGGVYVETSVGGRIVSESGLVRAARETQLDADEQPALPEGPSSMWLDSPALWMAAIAQSGDSLADHTIGAGLRTESGVSLGTIGPTGSRSVSEAQVEGTTFVAFGCDFLAQIPRVLGFDLRVLREGVTWEELFAYQPRPGPSTWFQEPASYANVVVASSGGAIAFRGRCGQATRMEEGVPVCWVTGDVARTLWFDTGSFLAASAVSSARLVYRGNAGRVLYVDVGDASDGARAFGRPVNAPDGLVVDYATILANGLFAGEAHENGATGSIGGRYLVIGNPERLEVRALPPGARGAAFADSVHAMAAGDRLGSIWTSSDGARHWDPVVLPVDGDADALGLLEAEQVATRVVWCTASLCIAGDRVLWMPGERAARVRLGTRVLARLSASRLGEGGAEAFDASCKRSATPR